MKGLIQHKVFVSKFSDESEAKRALGETKDKPLVIDGRKVKKKGKLKNSKLSTTGLYYQRGEKMLFLLYVAVSVHPRRCLPI